MDMDIILNNALTFLLVANPLGNCPVTLSLIKDYSFSRQVKIMLREALFALIIALFFQYLAEYFLDLLKIKTYAVTLCGGTLLFIISLRMIFSAPEVKAGPSGEKQEPFIVPIATPLISGPGLLTTIILKSNITQNNLSITVSIVLAWIVVTSIMACGPYLQRLLGVRGMLAIEQLMGLILSMIALQMIVAGIYIFLDHLQHLG